MEGEAIHHTFLNVNLDMVKKNLLKAVALCSKLNQYFLIEKMPYCILNGQHLDRFVTENNKKFLKPRTCKPCHLQKRCIGLEKQTLLTLGLPVFYKHYIRQLQNH